MALHIEEYGVLDCAERMCNPGINGDGKARGNQLTQIHSNMAVNIMRVCVCVCFIISY